MRVIKILSKKVSKKVNANMPLGTIFFVAEESNKDDLLFLSDKAVEFRSKELSTILKTNNLFKRVREIKYEITPEGDELRKQLKKLFDKICEEKKEFILNNYVLSYIRLLNLIQISYRIK